jgi:Type IV secretion system pilin
MNIFTLSDSQKSIFRTSMFFCLVVVFLAVPVLAFAQTSYPGGTNYPSLPGDQYPGLVPCDGPASIARPDRVCNFQALLRGVNGIINWLFIIAVPVSLAAFAYAGILFMTGKESNITEGKAIFTNVIWGMVIMAGGWLIVRTIVQGLLDPAAGLGPYLFGLF